MLIEFKTEADVRDIYQHCSMHQSDSETTAVPSPFLWFRTVQSKKDKLIPTNMTLKSSDMSSVINNDALIDNLVKCGSISEQIQVLYDNTKLNDIGTRLRYMVVRQLEIVFSSLYSNIVLRPFGSSVNGFGKIGCDLDLVFTNTPAHDMSHSSRRLVFQQKSTREANESHQLEVLAPALESRVSGVGRVIRILHARVPILKFSHLYADLDCDLCYNNMSGVYMSEMLHIYSTLDPRTAPLVFAVRKWANAQGLTCSHPGRWITGFPLSLMVLFFLQTCKILPSLNQLIKHARKDDIRIAEENLNCTFLRDLNHLPKELFTKNESNLESLLLQFFEFYSQFDFEGKAISINEGAPIRKPNSQPLYIVNPLATGLNVSKNVSYEECQRLKTEVRNAAWQLEVEFDKAKEDSWGLLNISENKSELSLRKLVKVGNSHRLLALKDIFKEEPEDEDDKVKTKATIEKKIEDKEAQKEQKIKFKNTQVRNEVIRIRRNKMA